VPIPDLARTPREVVVSEADLAAAHLACDVFTTPGRRNCRASPSCERRRPGLPVVGVDAVPHLVDNRFLSPLARPGAFAARMGLGSREIAVEHDEHRTLARSRTPTPCAAGFARCRRRSRHAPVSRV